MNTLNEHDRKLAETLRSLSLEPVPQALPPRKYHIGWLAGIPAAACIAALVLIMPAEIANHIRLAVSGKWQAPQPDSLLEPHPAGATPGTGSARPANLPPPPSASEMAGSGFAVAPRSTLVFSKYEGQVTGIAVEAGDRVEAGQTLVTLDDATARLALAQAKAARGSADLVLQGKTIALEQAAASLRRNHILAKSKTISVKALEDSALSLKTAQNAVDQAAQAVKQAEIAVKVAAEQVDALVVRAPFAGTVTRLNAHIGDTVLARADSVRENQSLLTLADTTAMVVDADVSETNIARLQPGLSGEAVLDGFPGHPFTVKIKRIAPAASQAKGTISLRLSLINPPDGIRPGMAARIRITVPNPKTQSGDAHS